MANKLDFYKVICKFWKYLDKHPRQGRIIAKGFASALRLFVIGLTIAALLLVSCYDFNDLKNFIYEN